MSNPTSSSPPLPQETRFSEHRYLDGVRTRRVFAFFIDYAIVLALVLISIPLVGFLGVLTLSVGWLLYGILGPLVALTYIGWTMGGPKQATIGMRINNIRLERYDGAPIDTVTAVVHAVLFWACNAALTPFIALVALFTRDKRMLHDLFLGTVVIRSDI